MKVIIKKDYEELSLEAAIFVKQKILEKPNLVLGLATGSTPLGTYQKLIEMHQKEGLDFSGITTFNLDEYVGLAASHPQSYHYYMWENLFNHINTKKENVFIPKGAVKDLKEYCHFYENQIKKRGGIDLQILGIGRDGHIGFNEPGSAFNSRTRVISLDPVTVQDNSRFFNSISEVPRKALTMGLATIMEAREILFLANGEHKAEIVARALEGSITTKVPASILQKHPCVTVILDQEAAMQITI